MREIKFRGQRIIDSKWVYGNLKSYGIGTTKTLYIETLGGIYQVFMGTVGLCTGFKDSIGTNVYEGDILEWFSPNSDTDGSNLSCKVTVFWDEKNGGFDVIGYENGLADFMQCEGNETVKVIGNIYDKE